MNLVRGSRLLLACASAAVAVLVLPTMAQGQSLLTSATAEPGKAEASVINLGDVIVVGESRATTADGEAGAEGSYRFLRVGEDDWLAPTNNPGGILECIDIGADLCLGVLASASTSGDDSEAFGTVLALGLTAENDDGLAILVADSSAGNQAAGTDCGAQSALVQIGTRFDEFAERIVVDADDAVGDCSVAAEDDGDDGDDEDDGDIVG